MILTFVNRECCNWEHWRSVDEIFWRAVPTTPVYIIEVYKIIASLTLAFTLRSWVPTTIKITFKK
jgi:hypothetical protein